MHYLVICSLIWAFSYGLIKGNLTNLSPDFIAFARMAIPFFLFAPFFRGKTLSKKNMFTLLTIGAVQYGLMYLFCIRAYCYLPAYQVVLFTAFTPLYVTLIHDLLNKNFQPFYLFTAAMALMGAGLLYQEQFTFSTSFKGFCLVQLSDLCFALGQVAYKHLRTKQKDLKDTSLYAILFLGGLMITALSTSLFSGWSSLSLLSTKQFYILTYLGAIASGLCFFWWNKAAVQINSGTLAICNNLKMPLGILASLLIFQEKADLLTLTFSSSLILLAVILTELHTKRRVLSLKKPR